MARCQHRTLRLSEGTNREVQVREYKLPGRNKGVGLRIQKIFLHIQEQQSRLIDSKGLKVIFPGAGEEVLPMSRKRSNCIRLKIAFFHGKIVAYPCFFSGKDSGIIND